MLTFFLSFPDDLKCFCCFPEKEQEEIEAEATENMEGELSEEEEGRPMCEKERNQLLF